MMNNQILDFAIKDTFDMYDTPLFILATFIYSYCVAWDTLELFAQEILPEFMYISTMMQTCHVEPMPYEMPQSTLLGIDK